jgi:hypothetical protein
MNKSGATHLPDASGIHGVHDVAMSAFLFHAFFHSRNFVNMQDGGPVRQPFHDQGATIFFDADLPRMPDAGVIEFPLRQRDAACDGVAPSLSAIKSSWRHDHTMELRRHHGQSTLKQPLADAAGGAQGLMTARFSSGRKLKRIENTNWQSHFICRANAVPTVPQISSR